MKKQLLLLTIGALLASPLAAAGKKEGTIKKHIAKTKAEQLTTPAQSLRNPWRTKGGPGPVFPKKTVNTHPVGPELPPIGPKSGTTRASVIR